MYFYLHQIFILVQFLLLVYKFILNTIERKKKYIAIELCVEI